MKLCGKAWRKRVNDRRILETNYYASGERGMGVDDYLIGILGSNRPKIVEIAMSYDYLLDPGSVVID